jgi:large subunit ribosomal protein L29
MKSRDIWEMTPNEIRNRLDDAHAELFNLRFQFSIGQMQNNARLGQVRRDIARLNTILRAKQLLPEGAQEQTAAPVPQRGRRSQ